MSLDPTIWNPALVGLAGADGKTIHTVSGIPSPSIGVDYDYAIDPVAWVIYGPKVSGIWPAGVNLIGADGANGPQGIPGPRGLKGNDGTPGTPGTPGTVIYSGFIDPLSTTGILGDFYYRLDTQQMWGPKLTTGWGVPMTLKGADGVDGTNGTNGVDGAPGADAIPLALAYGQIFITQNSTGISVTAATPSDLTNNASYIQVTGIFSPIPHGLNNDFTQTTDGLVCNRAGIYQVHLWAVISTTNNNVNVSMKYAINGTIAALRRPWAKTGNVGDHVSMAAYGHVQLAVGDVLTLWMAADVTTSVVIHDGMFAFSEMLAQGRDGEIQDEGVTVLNNPAKINFTGAGVTVTDVAGVATVTVPGTDTNTTDLVVKDEGSTVVTTNTLNFAGAGVTATASGGAAVVTIPGETHLGDVATVTATPSTQITVNNTDPLNPKIAWDGTLIQDEGVAQGSARTLNFVGAGVSAAVASGVATITVPGGVGGGGSYPFTKPLASAYSAVNSSASITKALVDGLEGLMMTGMNSSSNDEVGFYGKAIPTPPYTIKARISGRQMATYTRIGLGITDGTKFTGLCITVAGSLTSGKALEVFNYADNTTYSSTPATSVTSDLSDPVFMKITDDGTNLKFSYSVDDGEYTDLYTVARDSFLAGGGTHIGFMMGMYGTSTIKTYLHCTHWAQT